MHGSLSLRARLLVVLAVALLPLAALFAWSDLRETRAARQQAYTQLKFAASLLAAHEDRAVDAAEQLLGAIASMPQLLTMPRDACRQYLGRLREAYPAYGNLGLTDPQGNVVCHALGQGVVSVQDRDYYRQAIAKRAFVMGAPIVGRYTHRPSLPFALPVIEDGRIVAVAYVTLDLVHASKELSQVDVPPGARVAVADRHGQILMEYPSQPGRELLRNSTHGDLLDAGRTMRPQTGEGANMDGEMRMYAFAPGRLVAGEGLLVRVTIASDSVSKGAWARIREELMLLLVMVLAALAAVWWIGGTMIVRPAMQILGTVRRMEQGRLDARVPVHATGLRGEFARIGAAFNLMADSLQRHQAELEAELGRSRGAYAVLDDVLNSMQEGLIAVTATGQFLLYNRAAARLFPLEGAPLLPQLWPAHFGIYHADGQTPYEPDDLPLVRCALGESEGQSTIFVRNALVPEGRLVQCTWHIMRGESVNGGLVMFTDVTELQRLQVEQEAHYAQLQETQRKLVESQRIGRVGNWELDLRTGRLWWSDEVFELFGAARDGFGADLQSFEQRVHPDDRPMLKPARDRALLEGQVMNLEYRVVKPDGTIAWMHEIAETRRDAAGEPIWFGGVVQDITERKAIALENARLLADLQELNASLETRIAERTEQLRASNQELEAFSYSVSHDLRAPLAAISGFSAALQDRLGSVGDERAVHFLTRIQAGVRKMEELIEALLQLSRVVRAPLEWRDVDLSLLAREAIENLQQQFPGRRIDARVQDGLVARGDPRLLRILLENLVGNAWKFTSTTGDARVEVGRADANVFFVRDNGVGFDMAYAGKLFTAFQRLHTEREFPGTGIGLATVQRIVLRHQGRVWAESAPGEGTTFYFAL